MRVTTLLITLISLILQTIPSHSQEKSAETVLSYFPQGQYTNLSHFDFQLLRKGSAFPLYSTHFLTNQPEARTVKGEESETDTTDFRIQLSGGIKPPRYDFSRAPLPASMLPGLLTVTFGSPQHFTGTPRKPENEPMAVTITESRSDESSSSSFVPERGSDEETSGVSIESKRGAQEIKAFFVLHAGEIAVIQHEDLRGAIKQALQKGEMQPLGRRINGRPVFTFSKTKTSQRSDYFAWRAPTDELLIAEDIKHLELMIKTGTGDNMSIIDQADYLDLIDLFPDLGPAWQMHTLRRSREMLTEAAQQAEFKDDELERLKERALESPFFTITTVSLDDALVAHSYTAYETDQAAEDNANAKSGSTPSMISQQLAANPDFSSYQQALQRKTRDEILGNIIHKSIVYDQELLEKQRAARAAMQKTMGASGRMTIMTEDGGELELKLDEEPVKKK